MLCTEFAGWDGSKLDTLLYAALLFMARHTAVPTSVTSSTHGDQGVYLSQELTSKQADGLC